MNSRLFATTGFLSSRTNGGRLVHLRGDPARIGTFADVKITASNTWALYGEIAK